jgi:hypothetical protein
MSGDVHELDDELGKKIILHFIHAGVAGLKTK